MPGFLKVFGYPDPSAPGSFGIGVSFLTASSLCLAPSLGTLPLTRQQAHLPTTPFLLLDPWLSSLHTFRRSLLPPLRASSCAPLRVFPHCLRYRYPNWRLFSGGFVCGSNDPRYRKRVPRDVFQHSCAEVAPPHLRAVMVALFPEWVCVGSVLGAAVTNATKGWLGKASWRVPLGMLFVVPVMLSAGVWWVVPESPRWEVSRGRHQEGRMALERVRAVREDDKEGQQRLEVEWVEMVKGIEEEKRLASTVGPLDMFRGSDLRRTLLCFGVIATQAGSGSWFYISYSTYFMIVSGLPVDLSFRYNIMKTSMVQGMFMLGMAISATTTEAGTRRARGSLMACSALFFFCCLPELKGRALEEIDELFERRVPAWKFKSAETSIVSDAIEEVRRRRGEVGEDGGKAATVEIVEEREKEV
ncbi:uncharacterized protein B0T23DRAFT_395438 [Neurospora hispaniola]|uniref:Uncharacterized protein n=1 Tax=Neurospora hispaniola TaxID=588809 RepID=A0AAJ0MQV6_9PEZI|nr:hypothetical protein B0T23DRAFT_395438 [Neurospora hispaniola]